MKTYPLTTHYKKIIADTITPVSIYLKLRDKFPNSLLLESSDYHANDNSFSYICCNPIASIKVSNENITKVYPDGNQEIITIDTDTDVSQQIHLFSKCFERDQNEFKFINNGLFGYIAYDAVRYFEDVEIQKKKGSLEIPDIYYAIYQNIIAINHFNNEAYIFAHCNGNESNIDEIEHLLKVKNFAAYNFSIEGDITSNLNDEEFKQNVEKAKQHCFRGDVFQLVLSRRFSQKFKGDEFNVYRALRSINPSPYLFYFDYGDFKIFGSSPEAQLVVDKG
ncbi:MAG: chorismate-binding protein, partial [Flavobacteriaceae bacterium]|nr:chorismate-binding protein [Flavobacteriaceae bacterium]